jgi:hypothetical protein
VPGLRNLEKRLLHIEARLAPRAEPQVPMEQIRAIFDRMNEADRKRVSELKGFTREQIAAKISDDAQFRAFARRAISLATAEGLFRASTLMTRTNGTLD